MPPPLVASLVRRLHLHIRKQVFDDLVAAGHGDLTAAHMYVLQTPGPDGLRPTDLAAQTNMTKQAMNHLLSGLERGGYLERVPAQTDGRSKVLRATARGREVEQIMLTSAERIEAEWSAAVGKQQLEQLRETLRAIDELVAGQ